LACAHRAHWFPAYAGTTYAEDVSYLKRWIAGRIAWLDGGLAGACN
jgi:hypothetical protein